MSLTSCPVQPVGSSLCEALRGEAAKVWSPPYPRCRDRVALAILRLALGIFPLLWSVDKIVAPEETAKIFAHFYHVPLPVAISPPVGLAEAALSVTLLLGAWKTPVYCAAMAIRTVSTISTIPILARPFGENHLFLAAIPVWAAFLALFLLRRLNTLWSVSLDWRHDKRESAR